MATKSSTKSNQRSDRLEVKAVLEAPETPELLLVLCPDEIRRRRVCGRLLEKLGPPHAAGEEVVRIDGSALTLSIMASISHETLSPSLFASQRLFVVSAVDILSAAQAKWLIGLLEQRSSSVRWLLLGAKLPSTSGLLKFCRDTKALLELDELKGYELKRWVAKELKGVGIAAPSESVVDALVQLGEEDPDHIVRYVERLGLYADGESVSVEEVRGLFPEVISQSEYDLIDASVQRHVVERELGIDRLFRSGRNAFGFLSLCARQQVSMFSVRSMERQGSHQAIIRQALDLPPWLFNKLEQQSRTFGVERLRAQLQQCLKSDALLKNRSTGNDVVLMNMLDCIGRKP